MAAPRKQLTVYARKGATHPIFGAELEAGAPVELQANFARAMVRNGFATYAPPSDPPAKAAKGKGKAKAAAAKE